MSFLQRLSDLSQEAETFVKQKAIDGKKIALFSITGNKDEEWNIDINSDFPDFPYYDKHGFVDWAAIKEISHDADGAIRINGILKGESYPLCIYITLQELSPEHTIYLADYISKQIK